MSKTNEEEQENQEEEQEEAKGELGSAVEAGRRGSGRVER